jgi:hypothetical protein
MASAGPAAGRDAGTGTAPAGSSWCSGIPAMPSVGLGTRGTDTESVRRRTRYGRSSCKRAISIGCHRKGVPQEPPAEVPGESNIGELELPASPV